MPEVRRFVGPALLALAFVALPASVAAQETGAISGQVRASESGQPLAGAQVLAVGTGIGTTTNNDGRFLLMNLPTGTATIRVQMLGYSQVEREITVAAGQTTVTDFTMEVTAIDLDELIVTGQGRARQRRQLSTTVDVINQREMQVTAAQSVEELLRGRVAGATISATSAQPGTGSTINFRGVSSVFGSQTPVIYVDGVRVDNSDEIGVYTGGEYSSALSELLVSDIERIEITKGGAASTLYGSDAASGVIQIFTKKGSPGQPRFTARLEQGFDRPELKYMFDTGLIYPDLVDEGAPSNFLEENFFRTGHYQNYYAGVSGGTADVTYNVSGRVQDAEGVQPKNTSQVWNLRGGLQASVTDRLRLDFSGTYTRQDYNRIFNGDAIADPLTSFEVGDVFFFTGVDRSPDNFGEALDIFISPDLAEEVNRFIFSTGASYQISDLLTSRLTAGVDFRQNQQRVFEPIGFTPGVVEGELTRYDREFTSVSLDMATTVSYPTTEILDNSLTIGAQGFRDDVSTITATGSRFALPGAPDFDEAAEIIASEFNQELFNGGIYIEDQVGLWNQLFMNAGVRFDFNSTFGEEVDFETYPKLGASYLVSDAAFMEDVGLISNLKLRLAWGQTGKFPEPFLRDRTFSATPFRGESAPQFDNPGNPDLTAEVTSTLELGFDLAVLNERIGLGFTWYDATTDDALLFVPEDPVLAGGQTQLRNVGEINNTGIEVDLNALVLNRPTVQWSLNATYQTVENEVVQMGTASDFNVDTFKRVAEGHPVGEWYIRTPYDADGDGFFEADSLAFQGSTPWPTTSGSFGTDVTLYNRLSLSAMADWAVDFTAYDWGSRWAIFNSIPRRELVEGACTEPGVIDGDGCFTFPRTPDDEFYPGANSAYLVDGDYLKLREITARYALPTSISSMLNVDGASVWATVRNVAIWSANPMIDPELNGLGGGGNLALGGESSVTLSPPRQFRLGIEVTF